MATDKLDMTPTRLRHASGGIVNVPAYKAERLLDGGSFAPVKAAAAKSADSEQAKARRTPAKKAAAKSPVVAAEQSSDNE